MAIERDPCEILKDSVQDPDTGEYIHNCGNNVIGKRVYLTVLGGFGIKSAGSGEVIQVIQPCCPPCGIEPDAYGSISYEDTQPAQEERILRDFNKD